ncbi:MAG: Ni/Fe-hydrogenase cytochrome b subunit [Gemmatimonadota bacterium]|nr:MAG: Ni/Fe-hydrogenase cytochrome b subunit [Gemmatimonadota bacterium]
MNRRLLILKTALWALVGVLAVVTVARFVNGLGAVTNLSDAAPWGLWIGFDVMGGVALAAGGFVIAATVYIFGLERYRPFVRPAILTAFLGYVAVAIGLLYDLGVPWHIWYPVRYWQYHSALFEVAACVILYLTVLTLEFAPVVLEHPLFDKPLLQKVLSALRRVTIPLVIAGIVLSTLHQSSLGSLFLITPYRLHPLWYSPIMYVLFFISAVGLGLMMVTVESLLAAFFLDHKVHKRLLSGLGLAAAAVLGSYAVLRVGDLAVRGVLTSYLDSSWQSLLFVSELAISAIIPAGLLLIRRVRSSIGGLALCSALTVLGMVMYRLDVAIIAFARPEHLAYFPSWMEFAVTLGIVATFILIFIFFVENFRVYEDIGRPAAGPGPSHDPATLHALLPHRLALPRRFSLAAIAAAAVAVVFLPQQAITGVVPASTPVAASRTVDGVPVRRDGGGRKLQLLDRIDGVPEGMPFLMIDGNRNGYPVLFDHKAHEARLESDRSCGICHHIDKPFDRNTACFECHGDMYEPVSIFDHASHVAQLEGNAGCIQCHEQQAMEKTAETATACAECHADLVSPLSLVEAPADRWRDAVGYMEAMHGLCVHCHEASLAEDPENVPAALDRCDTCHDADRPIELQRMAPHATADRGEGAGQ